MDLKAGLWQKQTLKLAMTQELSQAIALLQYSAQELAAFLEDKMLENPLLQVDYQNVKTVDPRLGLERKTSAAGSGGRDQKNWIEQIGETSDTLQDHLIFQLNLLTVTPEERKIIKAFIESIDENGYLGVDGTEICHRFGISEEEAEHCLSILQGMEPVGIGARGLQECLLLQLERLPCCPENELARIIIKEHFLLFAEKKWKTLAKLMKTDLKQIQKVFDYVQRLNPRPGAAFGGGKAAYVVPDVVVRFEDGSLTVGLFNGTMPKLTFNKDYFESMAAHGDQEVSKFLQTKQHDYQWILKSLEQRNETLMRVSLKIVEKQHDFFFKGPTCLQPMTMKEVADELEIHESTVSRAVREKYMQTPAGTFELKYFFSSSIQTTEQENTSSRQAKAGIGRLIKEEDKKSPLSDQEIVRLLKDQDGIVLSRRTVAKYREQLGIASSSKRKRFE
ncbi:RNA polymerase factor sigma-54 [Bacillus massilinigeriensis]|uniref:RNA polymerase factor sigma-54 n=1 Tax=Bacillus mediterraneensis TaxID=1805474 RepID=UPI0008F8012B|nr:RNA polymerase factor sigma-54 [Bacillus mediterraneensis]